MISSSVERNSRTRVLFLFLAFVRYKKIQWRVRISIDKEAWGDDMISVKIVLFWKENCFGSVKIGTHFLGMYAMNDTVFCLLFSYLLFLINDAKPIAIGKDN